MCVCVCVYVYTAAQRGTCGRCGLHGQNQVGYRSIYIYIYIYLFICICLYSCATRDAPQRRPAWTESGRINYIFIYLFIIYIYVYT